MNLNDRHTPPTITIKQERIKIMKRGIPIILMALGLLLSLGLLRLWRPASTTGGPPPALQGEAALNHLEGQGLNGSLQEAVTAARYGFYQEPKRGGVWLAYNPAQRLSARLTPDGLQVVTGGDERRSHRLGMKLRSAGYSERQMAAKAGRLTASGARAEIHHELPQSQSPNPQSAIIEWYHNTVAGLEQGFTIESAPGERRDGERLRVALALEGELRVEAVEGGQALEFRDDAGRLALRYDHLVVKDGAGRKLEARMAAPEEKGEVWLEVNDRDAVWPVTIDPTFIQQQKLEASDATIGDLFGWSVAISGDTVVVGVPFDDGAAGSDQGSAYVFVRSSGGGWTQQQKLEASDGAADDLFGGSVAISGDTVVVGAQGDAGAAGLQLGSAYVFVRSGAVWSEQQKLEASDAAQFDGFGISVAIGGETVVVGAINGAGAAGNDQGSAYVFVRSGAVWTLQQKLEASDAVAVPETWFGESVAINGDTIVVGAPEYDGAAGFGQGAAYVFVRSGGVWTQQQQLLASDAAPNDWFGDSVAISGDTIAVGASLDSGAAGSDQGSAYVFVRSGVVWSEQQKLEASDAAANDRFGESVAISGDTVVAGLSNKAGAAGNGQGAAYVLVRSGAVWSEQQKLVASAPRAGARFGNAVTISEDTVVVGARNDRGLAAPFAQGSAYVFITAPTNTPPLIMAASVSRTQGLPASIGAITQVNDAEDALNTLTVAVNGAASATVNGVTVSSISVDASGQVTASVGADCNASNASFTLRVTDSGGLFAEATLNVTVNPETMPPVIACPVNVVMTLPPNTMDTGMVVNYPSPSATDNCTVSPIITTSRASGTVFPVGLTTVNVTATDAANNQATCSFTVTVRYNFSGFFQPVDNPPTVNVVNAGRAIPVKFSLSGDKGLNIFAAGAPASQQIACSDGAPASEIEQTVTAGGSSLSYDAASDTYTYVWKTEESWAGTCRQLILRLNDGSERVAFFKFK
jgi:FG-GAP repeat/HYR domain